MSVENPGGKRWWRGGYVCECQTLIIPVMEQRMIDKGCLKSSFDFYQYCYNSSVSASAGTHDYGGASDQAQDDWDCLTIMRECGGAAWARTPAQGFDPHCHLIICGCPHLSAGAADQETDYKNGRNGLANNGPDDGPDVPYITWQDAYAKYAGQEPAEEELFGMTKRISKYRGDSRSYQTDGWNTTIATDNEGGATIAQNTRGMCDVILTVTGGLAKDEEIGVRWQYLGIKGDSTNIDWQSQPIDLRSNGGTDRFQVCCHFELKPQENGWDHKLRLAISTGGKKVTIGPVETKGWED